MTSQKVLSTYEQLNYYQTKEITEPPKDLADFRNLSPDKKKSLEAQFFQQQHIQDYLDFKWSIELYNRDSFYRLYDLYQTTEGKEKEAVTQKLIQFKNKILENKNPFRALRIDFKKYPINEIIKEANWDEES